MPVIRTNKLLVSLLVALPASAALAQPSDSPPPADPPAAPAPDDLAKAADATAEAAKIAAPPSDAPVTPPSETPPSATSASDDIDLASLGLDPNAQAFDDKLNIYGFTSLNYLGLHWSKQQLGLNNTHNFLAGAIDLYLSKNITPKWRTLVEARLLYLPNGTNDATQAQLSTQTPDPADFSRPHAWGGVSIERAYVEYDVHPLLTVRAGRFLTPYGIWNIDHGDPAIISAYRPYVIGEQFFPEHQTGIELYGTKLFGDYKLGYHATVSNGRNPAEATLDPDNKVAFGGRLTFEAPIAGTLKVGVSGYAGSASELSPGVGAPLARWDERSYGADVAWDHGGLHVQSELIANERAYGTMERALAAGGFAPDGRQVGGYAIVGYRTDMLWNVMPYVVGEFERPLDHTVSKSIDDIQLGLNFRPVPSVVLKAQWGYAQLRGSTAIGDQDLQTYAGQIAWMF
jgi:hypothetical protein